MALRTIIFINVLLITNLLSSMEILKNIIKYNKHIKVNQTTIATLFAYNQQEILCKDVTNHILHYYIDLKYKDFINNKPSFKSKWFENSNISIDYFYLTEKQINIMQKLIDTERSLFRADHEVYYFLSSTKEYKLFLTLPLSLRKQLISPLRANTTTTILVKTRLALISDTINYTQQKQRSFFGHVAQPAIIEEQPRINQKIR